MYLFKTTSATSCGSQCYRLILQAFVISDCVANLSHSFSINFWILSYLESELMPLMQKAYEGAS